jgi:hypothetical protein
VPKRSYEQVKLDKNRQCVYCRGLRLEDRPKKRVTLAQIALNQGRESIRHLTFYGYKQYDVHLYRNCSCFDVFYR